MSLTKSSSSPLTTAKSAQNDIFMDKMRLVSSSRYFKGRSLRVLFMVFVSCLCGLFLFQHFILFVKQDNLWLCKDWIYDRIRYSIWPIDYTPRGNVTEMRRLYRQYLKMVETPTFQCDQRVRYGNQDDGGWDLCDEPPHVLRAPCIVHSWGINWDFSFDDSISSKGGCSVYSFDPSMNTKSYQRSDNVHFYSFGIKGSSINEAPEWDLRTYKETLQFLGQERKAIDFLKMDVEGAEWSPLSSVATQTDILRQVRQMALEVHIFHDITEQELRRNVETLRKIRELGFELFKTERNACGLRILHRNYILGYAETCCHNVHYVNTNFYSPI